MAQGRIVIALLLVATAMPLAGPAWADPILPPVGPVTPPSGGGGPVQTPAPVLSGPAYISVTGDNSQGSLIYNQQSGSQLLAAPVTGGATITNGTTQFGTTVTAIPQPVATATATTTGSISTLSGGQQNLPVTASAESTVTYHLALVDTALSTTALGTLNLTAFTMTSGAQSVPADQPLGASVSGTYASATARWYYTNGTQFGQTQDIAGDLSYSCQAQGTLAANTCTAVDPMVVTSSVYLNTDITVVVDATAVTSGWATASAYADPVFTIDPIFAAANPGAYLEFSAGIGDSADVPEPAPALALAIALAVWRRVSARRGEVEPAL